MQNAQSASAGMNLVILSNKADAGYQHEKSEPLKKNPLELAERAVRAVQGPRHRYQCCHICESIPPRSIKDKPVDRCMEATSPEEADNDKS